MIETVNESIVKIEPKIVLDGTVWGDITGNLADQQDLVTELAKKMNVTPTVLPPNTDINTVVGNGVYVFDYTATNCPSSGSGLLVVNQSGDNISQTVYIGTQIYNRNTDELYMLFDYPWVQYADTDMLEAKVDKVAGKSLSTNDYTTAEKNKLAGLFLPAYASIYVDNGNTAQSIPTGATYTKVTAYTTNGQSAKNCTADAANDKITITQAGVYSVTYTASYTADVNNVTFRGAVFLGGVEQGNIHSGGQMGLQGAMRSTACSGFINVATVPVDIDVRIRHDNGGTVAITHVYANLNIDRIG